MAEVFLQELFRRSIVGGILILAVMLMRLLLQRAPKRVLVYSWSLVGAALIFPVFLQSSWSLLPTVLQRGGRNVVRSERTVELVQAEIQNPAAEMENLLLTPELYGEKFSDMSDAVPGRKMEAVGGENRNGAGKVLFLLWLAGMLGMLGYGGIKTTVLERRVRASIPLEDKVYLCDWVPGPFLLGVFRPRIYLPSSMPGESWKYVLLHERAHLKRGDNFWKPFGYLILSIYWFHPLCWAAYQLFCRDIEFACDERATRFLEDGDRAGYCKTLLDCSLERKKVDALPVAFGEVSVKKRVKTILYGKKPTLWGSLAVLAVCGILSLCFLTNRKASGQDAEPVQEVTDFVQDWAEAFSDRDGERILTLSTEQVQKDLEERGLLNRGEDFAAFGFSSPVFLWGEGSGYEVISAESGEAEILYYGWTSDPYVEVWREKLVFSVQDGAYVVTGEEIQFLNDIASLEEYEAAYPEGLKSIWMDYTQNGLGEVLNEHALEKNSTGYRALLQPDSAARKLLNLSEADSRVKIEILEEKEQLARVRISFRTGSGEADGEKVEVEMIQPWGAEGIWVPGL